MERIVHTIYICIYIYVCIYSTYIYRTQRKHPEGPTVHIKSDTLPGQLCIEVAYLGAIIALWEYKNNSPQVVGYI